MRLRVWGMAPGLVSALAVSHWAHWGPSLAPCAARLHPAPLEEELVRPLPGWQPGLLPRRDAAGHGRPDPHQVQLPGRADRPRVQR